MLKNLARWLSGISEEAARRAVADLGAALQRHIDGNAQVNTTIERQLADQFAAIGGLGTEMAQQKQAALAVHDGLRRLDDQIAGVVQTTAAAIQQLENRLDQRQEALSVTLGYALRGIAFTNQGTALVRTASEHLTNIFDNLSDDMLLRLAEAMATLGPLATKRQWRFGDFEYSLDLAVHIRRSLWLSARARGLRDPIIVPWHANTKLALRLDNDLSLTFFSSGIFEPNEFFLLDRLLKPGMVFVDGGANEGLYSVFASARVGEQGRVISVEPSPRELGRLRQNLALNAVGNVDVVEAALAERSELLLNLQVAEDAHSGQNTLGAFAYQGIATSAVVEVAALSLDDIVRQSDLRRLDIVKLDIEGAEIRALRGAARVLAGLRPMLFIEMSAPSLAHQGGSPSELVDLLREQSYIPAHLDDETGQPMRLDITKPHSSNTIVAVPNERSWEIL